MKDCPGSCKEHWFDRDHEDVYQKLADVNDYRRLTAFVLAYTCSCQRVACCLRRAWTSAERRVKAKWNQAKPKISIVIPCIPLHTGLIICPKPFEYPSRVLYRTSSPNLRQSEFRTPPHSPEATSRCSAPAGIATGVRRTAALLVQWSTAASEWAPYLPFRV